MQVIVPGEAMRYGLRMVAYAPNGARLGLLGQHLGFEVAQPLNDVPSLRLSYPQGAAGAELLGSPVEIALEHAIEGGGWVEPPNARFLRIKRGGDNADRTGARTYSCPGYAWMLRKLVLYPNGQLIEGKRAFNAVSVGAILRTLLNEGQARGTLPGLVAAFTTTHDSAGQPWSKVLTLALEPGVDLLTLLLNLAEQGVIDWQMTGRTLQVYNEGGELTRDLASGDDPVDLRLGRDIDQAPDDATLEDLSSAVLIAGENSLSVEVTNASAIVPWGRWETYQKQGGVSDEGTATLLGQYALERVSSERVQLTRQITPYAARWLPWAHYRIGDLVLAPGDGAVMQSLRVRQITLTCNADGHLGGNLVLNDRFLETDIKLARQAAGILNGGISSGGTGGTPAPEQPGGRVAAPPQGLIVEPAAYVDEYGFARGQITATWSPVTADTSGVALDPDRYELYVRVNGVGEVWRLIATSDDTTATYSPLVVAEAYGFKVRAVAQGTPGEFSAVFVALIPDDVTPPPVPPAPALSTRLGVIEVAWDGLAATGAAMPADFELVRVLMAADEDGPWGVVDHLRAAGAALVADQPYGEMRWFRFAAVDRRGNESAPSTAASIATQPLVDRDVIGKVLDGANIIDGTVNAADAVIANTITGALIQALAIDTPHLRANSVTVDQIAAGSVDAAAIQATAITGKTITGSLFRTAAAGRRIVLDPATLDMRFYPNSGSNFSRMWTSDTDFAGEATFRITSGTNPSLTAQTYLTIAAGWTKLEVLRPGNGNPNGGFLESAEAYSRIGYDDGSADNQYMWFDATGMTTHYGKWWDSAQAAPTWGIHSGSRIASSGWTGMEIAYGPTMQDNMGPVAVIRDGALTADPGLHPNVFWAIERSTPTSFLISWAPGGGVQSGKAIYWWAHRHNGSA